MKVVKYGEFDYIFFINNSELEDLKKLSLEGQFWNCEYPYECFNKKVSLRLALDSDTFVSGGGGCNSERTEFWVVEKIYDGIKQKGSFMGGRYDTHGNKFDIINYEYKIIDGDISYRFLRRDLDLI